MSQRTTSRPSARIPGVLLTLALLVPLVVAASSTGLTPTSTVGTFAWAGDRSTPETFTAEPACGEFGDSDDYIMSAGNINPYPGYRAYLVGDTVILNDTATGPNCAGFGPISTFILLSSGVPAGQGVTWQASSGGSVVTLSNNQNVAPLFPLTIEFLAPFSGNWELAGNREPEGSVRKNSIFTGGVVIPAPSAPTIDAVTVSGSGNVELAVTPPSTSPPDDNDPYEGYQYRIYDATGTVPAFTPAPSGTNIFGDTFGQFELAKPDIFTGAIPTATASTLPTDTELTIDLQAVNIRNGGTQNNTRAFGIGAAASDLIVIPSAPTNAEFTVDDTDPSQATLTFTPVTAPAGYTYTYEAFTDTGWQTLTLADPANPSVVVTGVSTFFPSVQVRAVVNGVNGAAAIATDVTPQAVEPDPPTATDATAGNESATVTWTAPANDGGSPIAAYRAQVDGNPTLRCFAYPPATSCEITGLTNGTPYSFTVAAINDVGASVESNVVGPVTPSPSVPGAPTATDATPGDQSATVTWTAPASDGGSPITQYRAQVDGDPTLNCTVAAPATSCEIGGLTNGTEYSFTVAATNAIGTSVESNVVGPVTPATVPDPPTAVSATAGDESATVSWTAPADDGGSPVTAYRAEVDGDSSLFCVIAPPATSCDVTGLTNGTEYSFVVTALNAAGLSDPSAPSDPITPARAPDAPTATDATAGNESATITWTAPANDGGSPITQYRAQVDGDPTLNCTVAAPATSCEIGGLTNGTEYSFTVAATNAIGTSVESNVVGPVTPSATVPDAPTATDATAGNQSATITWTAPTNDGGSPITQYRAQVDGDPTLNCTVAPPATSCDIGGLTNGDTYSFTVAATNALGTSAESNVVGPVTPATVPDAPVATDATPGIGSATVTWTLSASSGGSPITQYRAQVDGDPTLNCTVAAPATSCDIGGLANGTAYSFTVAAINAVGTSPESNVVGPVTPVTPPTTTTTPPPTTTPPTPPTPPTPTTTPNPDNPIVVPDVPETSELISETDAEALGTGPGGATILVNGEPVAPVIGLVNVDGADVPPEQRTPEQIEAIRRAARQLVDTFNAVAGDGSPIGVTNTPTGAVITGLLADPANPGTTISVPAERVMVVTGGDVAALMVATNGQGGTVPLSGGALDVPAGGKVAMALAGLPPGTNGEVVLLPSRLVLGTFSSPVAGILVGQTTIPADLATGSYSIAVAAGDTQLAVGVKASPAVATGTGSGRLPSTGAEPVLALWALVLLGIGLVLVRSRRRPLDA